MGNLKVLQVVGFKNSGKTALLSRFIESAKKAGKKTAAIKHHGHGGSPDMPPAQTDSMRFLQSGAACSLVAGGGMIQMQVREQEGDLENSIRFSLLSDPELILVEGFKEAGYPKVVLVRNPEDWKTLQALSNIRLVVVHEGVQLENTKTVERSEQKVIDQYFAEWMEGESDESV